MAEPSVQIPPVRPRSRIVRGLRGLFVLACGAALALWLLPHAWLAWHTRPARSLEVGASQEAVLQALGTQDVRLPLDPQDPYAGGAAECWMWFWPDDPLRKVCKRLPFLPESTAFDLEERGSAMVRAFFDRAGSLQSIEIE